MYREGHLGAALLVYAPLAFMAALIGGLEFAVIGGAIAGGLASVPDLDMRVPLISHRGPTHTVWFAILIGTLLGIIGAIAGLRYGALGAIGLFVFAFLVGALSIASHIAADALTPMGIRPFTPWRADKYTWDLVKAANPVANYALLVAGGSVAVGSAIAGVWLRQLLGF